MVVYSLVVEGKIIDDVLEACIKPWSKFVEYKLLHSAAYLTRA